MHVRHKILVSMLSTNSAVRTPYRGERWCSRYNTDPPSASVPHRQFVGTEVALTGRIPATAIAWEHPGCHHFRMAKNIWSNEELTASRTSPGWRLEADQTTHEGTLEDVAKLANERRARGEHPGLIRQIETSIELDMLQLEALWFSMGLPV